VKAYLAKHEETVAFLDSCPGDVSAAAVDRHLQELAEFARERGMGAAHWESVVDGLVAHVMKKRPKDELLVDLVRRGFDLCLHWGPRSSPVHA
jgi:hypothetical protein